MTALGGAANLIEVGACTTRLRLVVADQSKVDATALKALGSRGMIRPAPDALQGRRQNWSPEHPVLVGPDAEAVAAALARHTKEVD